MTGDGPRVLGRGRESNARGRGGASRFPRPAGERECVEAMAMDRNPGEPLITFTDAARDKLLEILDEQNLRGTGAVRISILGRGAGGFEHGMHLEPEGEPQAGDATFQVDDLRVFVDGESAALVGGAT